MSWIAPAAAAGDKVDGTMVYVTETFKEGAKSGIDTILQQQGGKYSVSVFSYIFKAASLASDFTEMLKLVGNHMAAQTKLQRLRGCAEKPTNPVSASDPNYSKDTPKRIDDAIAELVEVNRVRFLNRATDTTSGTVSPWMFVLKAGMVWSERALEQFVDKTIMREAEAAVVPCVYPLNARLEFEYSNHYDTCDNGSCHRIDERELFSADVVLETDDVEGYTTVVKAGTLNFRDTIQYVSGPLLPLTYQKLQENTANTVPQIQAYGSKLKPGTGIPSKEYAERMKGKRHINVRADAELMVYMTRVNVLLDDSKRQYEATENGSLLEYTRIDCSFDEVNTSIGGTYNASSISHSRYIGYRPDGVSVTPTCTLKTNPIYPR
jgi:hypothetical protein